MKLLFLNSAVLSAEAASRRLSGPEAASSENRLQIRKLPYDVREAEQDEEADHGRVEPAHENEVGVRPHGAARTGVLCEEEFLIDRLGVRHDVHPGVCDGGNHHRMDDVDCVRHLGHEVEPRVRGRVGFRVGVTGV